MKKSRKLAISGALSAFSIIIMLAAYFPYLTYAIPAAAGILFSVIVIEVDKRYAFAAYFITSIISFFLCENEAKILFILFFGYYPILKSVYESVKSRVLEYALKLITFNVAITAAYLIILFVFNIPLEFSEKLGVYVYPLAYVLGNAVFLLYDFALTRLLGAYNFKLHSRVKKLFY